MYVHTLFIVYFVQLLDRCHHVYILLLTACILSNVKALSLLQMIGILPCTQKVTRSPHTGLNDFSLVVFLESFFVEPLDLPFLMRKVDRES